MKYRIDWNRVEQGYVEVEGESVAFPGYGRWTFFVAKRPDGDWCVTEISTGACVSTEGHPTRLEAMIRATENFAQRCTPQKFGKMVAKVLREHGPIAERTAPRKAVPL